MKHLALFLHDIYFRKRTGRLVFKRGDIEKYFFFRTGDLLQIKTNQPNERLGEVLFRLEKITQDDHARMDDFIEANTNIGQVLRGRGLISEEDLEEALVYQLRETVLNSFPYFDADIVFQERADTPVEKGVHRISVPFLIEYGIRRMAFDPALKGFLSKKTPRPRGRSMVHLLTEEEKTVLAAVDGAVTSEKLLAALRVPVERFWRTLFLLHCLDLVDAGAEPAEAAGAPPPEPVAAPSAEPAPAAGAADGKAAEISEVEALLESLETNTYYQILGVARTANEDEIKKAYFGMARRFHPDRFDRKVQAEHRELIDEVFDAVTNAYRTLISKEKRKAYDSGATAQGEDQQDVLRKADIKFRQGKTLYAQERFDDAVSLLEEAVRIRKNKGDYYLLLAMAESKIPAYRKKAEEDFLKAIGMEPWNPEGHAGLALLYKNEGLLTKAAREFQKALEADPEHRLARQELAAINKANRPRGLKGLLSMDLFGSKKK
jgi:curved DNA-binding protein CbpA